MDTKTDRLIRRTAMVASVTAAYLLLTADYGPQANALDPIKRGIKSVGSSVEGFFFGRDKENEDNTPSQPKEPEQHEKEKLK